jgi:hypothetical protein
MDFHGLLRCAQVSGNLLVQHTCDYEPHYFELARRQQIKKSPRLIFSALRRRCSADRIKAFGHIEATHHLKRLPKKIDRAGHRLRTSGCRHGR